MKRVARWARKRTHARVPTAPLRTLSLAVPQAPSFFVFLPFTFVFERPPSPPPAVVHVRVSSFPCLSPSPPRRCPPLPLLPASTLPTRPLCRRRHHSLSRHAHSHHAALSVRLHLAVPLPSRTVNATKTHLAVVTFFSCTKTPLKSLGKHRL